MAAASRPLSWLTPKSNQAGPPFLQPDGIREGLDGLASEHSGGRIADNV